MRRGNVSTLIAALCLRLVDCRCTRPYARPDIRQADGFQEALDGAVFAEFAMQRQEGNIEIAFNQGDKIFLLRRVEDRNREPSLNKRFLRAFPTYLEASEQLNAKYVNR